MPHFDAVLFDLDGTLLYTLPDIHAAVCRALTLNGYGAHTMEDTRRFVGTGSREVACQLGLALPRERGSGQGGRQCLHQRGRIRRRRGKRTRRVVENPAKSRHGFGRDNRLAAASGEASAEIELRKDHAHASRRILHNRRVLEVEAAARERPVVAARGLFGKHRGDRAAVARAPDARVFEALPVALRESAAVAVDADEPRKRGGCAAPV